MPTRRGKPITANHQRTDSPVPTRRWRSAGHAAARPRPRRLSRRRRLSVGPIGVKRHPWRLWVAIGGILLVLLVAAGTQVSEILNFLHLWWDGKPLDDHALGSVPAFWVARSGKICQIAAGMVVVVDLLTTRWLADWANHASVRAKQRGVVVRHRTWLKKIRRDLVWVQAAGRSRVSAHLQTWPPKKVPRGLPLTLSEYKDFHRQVIKQAECEHSCEDKSHRAMCHGQKDFVTCSIEKLAIRHLTPSERVICIDYNRPTGGHNMIVWYATALSIFLFCNLAIILPLREWLAQDQDWSEILLIPAVYIPTAIVLAITHPRSHFEWYRLHKWLAGTLLRLAAESPPFRTTKMLALGAFLVGAVLDLLAS